MKKGIYILVGVIIITLLLFLYDSRQLNKTDISRLQEIQSLPTAPTEVNLIKNLLLYSKQQKYQEALEIMDDNAKREYKKNRKEVIHKIYSFSDFGNIDRFEITNVYLRPDKRYEIAVDVFSKNEKIQKHFILNYNNKKAKWEILY